MRSFKIYILVSIMSVPLMMQVGTASHDSVKLPFQLPAGSANECQFTFYVQSFLVPQKLRGTATYMVKVGGDIECRHNLLICTGVHLFGGVEQILPPVNSNSHCSC